MLILFVERTVPQTVHDHVHRARNMYQREEIKCIFLLPLKIVVCSLKVVSL